MSDGGCETPQQACEKSSGVSSTVSESSDCYPTFTVQPTAESFRSKGLDGPSFESPRPRVRTAPVTQSPDSTANTVQVPCTAPHKLETYEGPADGNQVEQPTKSETGSETIRAQNETPSPSLPSSFTPSRSSSSSTSPPDEMGACGGHAYNYAAELNNSSGQEPDSSTGSHGHVCIEYEGGGHRLKFDVKCKSSDTMRVSESSTNLIGRMVDLQQQEKNRSSSAPQSKEQKHPDSITVQIPNLTNKKPTSGNT